MAKKWVVLFLIGSVALFNGYQLWRMLEHRLQASGLRAFTEKRIGDLLNAEVRIGRISFGPVQHIALTGLEINPAEKDFPVLVDVERIVFRYRLDQILKRSFNPPQSIALKAPQITLTSLSSSSALLNAFQLASSDGMMAQFDIEGGRIRLPWFRDDEALFLSSINGKVLPSRLHFVTFKFSSELEGMAIGKAEVAGQFNPNNKSYGLSVQLRDAMLAPETRIPITHLNGEVEIGNDIIKFKNVRFLFRGLSCQLNGDIVRAFSEKPVARLSFTLRDSDVSYILDVNADFETETISGALRFLGRTYRFSGTLVRSPSGFEVTDASINEGFQAKAQFDPQAGSYEMVTRDRDGRRQFRLSFSLTDFEGDLGVELNHWNIAGFDLVTSASAAIRADENAWAQGLHTFDISLKTGHVIFEYQPLRDFEARARLSASGLSDLVAKWGDRAELRGTISWGHASETDLVLRMGGVSLEGLSQFGKVRLPRSLRGTLEGELHITHSLETPQLEGNFKVVNGQMSGLEYDRAAIQFSGKPPYLALHDSRIWKGNKNFLLKGGFNFSLRNFLKGVQVVNSERVVIWKGWALDNEYDEQTAEELSRLESDAVSGVPVTGSGAAGLVPKRAKLKATYRLGDRSTLQVAAEEDQNDGGYLVTGPTVSF